MLLRRHRKPEEDKPLEKLEEKRTKKQSSTKEKTKASNKE